MYDNLCYRFIHREAPFNFIFPLSSLFNRHNVHIAPVVGVGVGFDGFCRDVERDALGVVDDGGDYLRCRRDRFYHIQI